MKIKSGEDFSRASNNEIACYFAGMVNGFCLMWINSGESSTLSQLAVVVGWLTALGLAYPFMRGFMGALRPESAVKAAPATDQQDS
ncbi:TPA: hypothetical protein ACIRVE_005101 [Pseudomonas putida]